MLVVMCAPKSPKIKYKGELGGAPREPKREGELGDPMRARKPFELFWARTQGHCKRGSGGQRKVEKIRATFWDCEGFIGHRPPGSHPRIRLALPSLAVDLASIQHRFDIEIGSNQEINVESILNRCQIDP